MMADTQIRFEDGLSYERYMGDWSRRVGIVFLDWLAAPSGLKWIDVGCGNSAFTELLVQRCAPTEVIGIDPSEAQLDFARKRSDRVRQSSTVGTPWPFRSRQILSMSRQWHW